MASVSNLRLSRQTSKSKALVIYWMRPNGRNWVWPVLSCSWRRRPESRASARARWHRISRIMSAFLWQHSSKVISRVTCFVKASQPVLWKLGRVTFPSPRPHTNHRITESNKITPWFRTTSTKMSRGGPPETKCVLHRTCWVCKWRTLHSLCHSCIMNYSTESEWIVL